VSTPTTSKPRELAHRVTDGLAVSLFWHRAGNTLTLEVYDSKTEEFFELEVPRDRALDAFHHPFAYLAAAEALPLGELLAA
jgi:hypothetical protein